jgi:hypothetical protein
MVVRSWFLRRRNSWSSHQLAKTVQKTFAEDIKQFPKVEGIPTRDEIDLMEKNLRLLKLPFSIPNNYDPHQIVKRTPAVWMKKTNFFSLPEASLKSGIIIDADSNTEQLQIQSFGVLSSLSRKRLI